MSNFTLIKPDASTLAITVTDIGTMFDGSARGAQAVSPNGMTYGVGDFVDEVQPIQFKVSIIDHQGAEGSARDEIAALRSFAMAAKYLKRDSTGYTRELQAGNALLSLDPEPIGSRLDVWMATITLLPLTSSWTSAATTTITANPSGVWFYRSDGSGWSSTQPWTGLNSATVEEHAAALFSNVLIPAGSTITAASITTNSLAGDGGGAQNVDIYGYKHAANPSAPVTLAAAQALDTSANRTTATKQWVGPLTYITSGLVTPDITSVIQEVVNQSYWASGQSLLVFFNGNQANGGGGNYDTELDTTLSNWTLSVTYS